ncbi:TPA: nucleobase:cation symporter-2 family protein [Streptococcus pyogenes]|uniref:nucleobase:cation symporter-2 family protein n=1 Tax=Streptococcus pyogenes TaxID=1314 RepID=UPI0004D1B6E3|nr:nucleobase:cation symporter-2 family protein [Streptococcus pyogenes]HER4566110.1 purine permease [Streptococcus pyogenes NGAS629]HER4575074.1 purine permease [Streptococcus pyogenes NGAS643]HER4578511.1 purine permease [Streptococcus pyogenes NGAS633]HER4583591.1 purine permease [Streptococcus pyogenes NGAS655]HER4603885.1 purine permease [Streptococcus pyogenes NGAS620]HER4713200.1 purine permease [Streptococcus pyogenes NGAS320]HER4717115.1 purine permease [Streptococcus pyogenes NGAS3
MTHSTKQEHSHSQSAVLGLQHVLSMYAGSILVPIMIAGALGYSARELTYLISTDIFMCGVATFLQLKLTKHTGVGLPVVLGCAFQSVVPLSIIGAQQGSSAMFGALIASGIYVILVAGIFSKIARFFPPIVTGSVITVIGLSLVGVAMGNMGDNVKEPAAQSMMLSLLTIVIILLVQKFTKGFVKSISILIGLVAGTLVSAMMGLVDTTPVVEASWIHVPTPFYFGMPTFEITSIVMMCIIATVSMVESTGVYLALSDLTNDQLDEKRLRNGYRSEGIAVFLGGLFNTFPYTGFSQNVGLVQISGIKTRRPIYYAAGILVVIGLLPKFGAMAQMIPSPVLGGAMLVLFGMVALQGMQMLNRVDFQKNEYNFIIAAVSISAGLGFNGTNLFASLPETAQMFLTNGIVIATLTSVVLNLVLNGKDKQDE